MYLESAHIIANFSPNLSQSYSPAEKSNNQLSKIVKQLPENSNDSSPSSIPTQAEFDPANILNAHKFLIKNFSSTSNSETKQDPR